MVEDYLSEDEQAEALKSWWKENWLWILSGIALGLAILAGWQFYQRYQTNRAEGAATALQQYAAALTNNDTDKANGLLKEIDDKYASTPYHDQAHLLHARVLVEGGNFDQAANVLREVAAKGKDAELAKIAGLRLARVLTQQEKYDEALALLDVSQAGAFAGEVHELRGDVYYAKGDTSNARSEYQTALAADNSQASSRSLLELKLQDLGDAVSPAAAAQDKKP